MRNAFCLFILCLAAITAMGCSSISVHHDYDAAANWASYKTFDWIEQPMDPAGGNAQDARAQNSLLAKRIMNAVNAQLAQRGMYRDIQNPTLLLAYHTGVQSKVDVTNYGYSYGYGYYGWQGSNVDVYQYNEGTLIIDLIDASTKELVWRGVAQKTLADNPRPEQIDKTINDAVAKIFQKYPPKK